jgi:hypothetical protein
LKGEIKMGAKIDKIKAFVARHKKDILFVGGTILAVTVTAAICKSDKEKEEVVVERLPEWAEKWKDH